jgi:phosphoribosylglycinamide formyltransferase 1
VADVDGTGDRVPPPMDLAVLVSGSGTNLQALLDDPGIRPYVTLVLSDRPGVKALERAADAGVSTDVIEPSADRAAFDGKVLGCLRSHGVRGLVSAGYMRLLGPLVLDVYGGRWLNVHPSLLPSFPGMHSVRDALEHGVKVTGVTVFLVDAGIDTGPILLQEAIPVLPDDDWDSLEARVHDVEHRLLPEAVRALLDGRIHVQDGRARIEDLP